MNGTRAREIRKAVYPYSVSHDLRDYHQDRTGATIATGFRAKYKQAKKAYKKQKGETDARIHT